MKALTRFSLLLCALGVTAIVTSATPIGPVYPPPGGVTFSATGLPGNSGGRTNSYSNLDPSAYTDLYWGLWSSGAVEAGLDGQLHVLTFDYATATDAYFRGVTGWVDADPYGGAYGTGGWMTVPLMFSIHLTGASFVPAASLGLDSGLGVLADINGTSFTANLQFLANYGYGWQPLNSVPQEWYLPNSTVSSFSGGFYSTPPVPDAAGTLGLLACSVLGLLALRRGLRRT